MVLEKVRRLQIGLLDGIQEARDKTEWGVEFHVEEITWNAQLPKIDFNSAADFVERSFAAECFLYLIKNMINDKSVS